MSGEGAVGIAADVAADVVAVVVVVKAAWMCEWMGRCGVVVVSSVGSCFLCSLDHLC